MRPASVAWMLAVGVALLLLNACADDPGGSSQVGALDCARLVEGDTYAFEIESFFEIGGREGEPVGDDQYSPEPFQLRQLIEGVVDHGRVRAITSLPEFGESTEQEIIAIDDAYWLKSTGQWVRNQAGPGRPWPIPVLPWQVCAGLRDLQFETMEGQPGKSNGVNSTGYTLRGAETSIPVAVWGSTSDVGRLVSAMSGDVWIANRERIPVSVQVDGRGKYESGRDLTASISMEITDLGKKGIRVEPPE